MHLPFGTWSPLNSPSNNTGSGLPFPSLGDLPNPGIEPGSPALREILYDLSSQRSLPFWKKGFINWTERIVSVFIFFAISLLMACIKLSRCLFVFCNILCKVLFSPLILILETHKSIVSKTSKITSSDNTIQIIVQIPFKI